MTSLRKHPFLIVFMLLLGTAGGFARGIIELNSYTADAQLLLRPGLRESTSPESVISSTRYAGTSVSREVIANEVQILGDPALYRRAAAELGPISILERPDPTRFDTESTPVMTRWMHRAQLWHMTRGDEDRDESSAHAIDDCDRCVELASRILRRSTFVNALRDSSVIQIQVVASSPLQAQRNAEAVQRAAIAHHMETFSGSASRLFLQGKVEAAGKRLEQVEASRFKIRAEAGIYELDQQLGTALNEIHAAENSIASTAIARAQLDSRLALLESLMEGEEPTVENLSIQPPQPNPEVSYLRQRLYSLYSRRLDFASVQGETLTERQERQEALETSIVELQNKLESERPFLEPVEVLQVSPNPRYAELTSRIDGVREELAGVMAGTLLQKAQLDKQRSELARLTEYEPRIRELDRKIEANRMEFDSLASTSERFAMIDELDQGNMSNLVPARAPMLPLGKSGPNRSKYLMLGVTLGLFSALGLVFLLEANQPRVVSPGEAEHVFADETLALETVPTSAPRRRRGNEEPGPTDWT